MRDTNVLLVHPLHPGLTPRIRADGSVQLGRDPVHGVVLAGLAGHEAAAATRLLRVLAEASAPVSTRTLAGASGLPEERVRQIVRTLDEAGLTRPDQVAHGCSDLAAWSLSRRGHGAERSLSSGAPLPVRERREGARVVIDGRGTLVDEVARLLRAAHVGAVHAGWYAGVAGELDEDGPDPGLIVTIGTRLPVVRAMDWFQRSIAHLPVVARSGSVDIGPLVGPAGGPCLSCVRLHEGAPLLTDLAPDDPLTDAQDDPVRVEPSLAGIVAGAVTMLALGLVDSYPPPPGVRWHTALPLPSLATSRGQRHPLCDAAGHRSQTGRARASTWAE